MVTRFRNRFGMKSTKAASEAAISADEEVATPFPAELKKLIKVRFHPWLRASSVDLGTHPAGKSELR